MHKVETQLNPKAWATSCQFNQSLMGTVSQAPSFRGAKTHYQLPTGRYAAPDVWLAYVSVLMDWNDIDTAYREGLIKETVFKVH